MCIYIFVYMYMFIYVYIYMHKYRCTYACVYIYVHMNVKPDKNQVEPAMRDSYGLIVRVLSREVLGALKEGISFASLC